MRNEDYELIATAFELLAEGANAQTLDMMKRSGEAVEKLENGISAGTTASTCLQTAILFTCIQDLLERAAKQARDKIV